jgi:hypothetical protein
MNKSIVITVVVMGLVGSGTAIALDGSGTEGDPWLIQSLEDFNDFAADANYWAGYTRLETDVNLAGLTYTTAVIAPDVNNTNNYFDGTAFTGVFDGNDHRIMNLTIDDGGVGKRYLALFGYIYEGEASNLGLEGGSVSGRYSVGGLVGENRSGTISNCYSTGSVNGGDKSAMLGGLLGFNYYGSVSNSYSTCDVNGVYELGGLAGDNIDGIISNCYSTGDVSGNGCVGGLVGGNAGTHSSFIMNCYSTGDVSGDEYVGGLVGQNGLNLQWEHYPGYINNSYSTGSVQGDSNVGGLVGYNELGDIEKSYWNIETSSEPNMCGYQDSNATGCDPNYGKTTSAMKQHSTFTNWDFINTWNIGENQTYPYLRTVLPSDINKDRITNFLDIAITANQWMEGVE